MSGAKVDVKVVLLGKEYGGKTSLVERYLHNRFCGELPYQNTIGAAYGAKRIEVFGRPVVMGIWDTAGSERYQAMSRIYYRDAWAAIICFDLTDLTSFEKARFWVTELKSNEPECCIYFAATKKDLASGGGGSNVQRQVDFLKALDLAQSLGAIVFETSSRTGENVSELFERIAKDYVKSQKVKMSTTVEEDTSRLHLDDLSKPKASGCQNC